MTDDDLPPPVEIVDGGDALHAFFGGEEPTPFTARGAAFMWWSGIINRAEFLDPLATMTFDADAWGDFSEAAEMINGFAMMEFIEHPLGYEDRIGYAKFMPDAGHPIRAFGDSAIPNYVVLTVVLCDDNWWRVFAISPNYFPTVEEILD